MNILLFKSSKGVGTASPLLLEYVSSILFLRLLTLMTSPSSKPSHFFFLLIKNKRCCSLIQHREKKATSVPITLMLEFGCYWSGLNRFLH